MKYVLFLICFILVAVPAYAQTTVRIDGGFKITPIADVTVTNSATLIHAADPLRVTLSWSQRAMG